MSPSFELLLITYYYTEFKQVKQGVSMEHNDQMFNFSDLMDIHDVPVKDIDPAETDIEDDKNNKRSSKQYHARGEQKLKSVVGKKPVHTNPLLNAMVNNL